jgi:type IX secretion system PorP/SprF family membrane protein
MKNLTFYIALITILISNKVFAQQEPMYGQYIFNNSILNPAQAGANGSNQFGVQARSQWLGIEGAPQTLTAYGNLILPKNLGLAFGFYQDMVAVEINQHFQTDLAYHLKITQKWYISGGIRVIASYYRANLTQVPNVDPNNTYFNSDFSSGMQINAGFGFLAYDGNSFIGFSIPKVFSKQLNTSLSSEVDFERNKGFYFNAYAGTNLKLSESFIITPSAVFRYSNAPLQIDINAIIELKNIFDFGPVIRMNFVEKNRLFDAAGFLMSVRLWERVQVGYLYEYPLSELNYATVQTHEISLRYFIPYKGDETKRPDRYFL